MRGWSSRNSGAVWTESEINALKATLSETKDATSFHDDWAILEMLSEQFGRNQKMMKKKAIELGFRKKVDHYL